MATRYTVMDGLHPANREHPFLNTPIVPKPDPWAKSTFDTFEEAIVYTHHWLGVYSPGKEYLTEALQNQKRFDYSGFGDTVAILTTEV